MIVHAGIMPYSPLLLPAVHKDQQNDLAATLDAVRDLVDHAYAVDVETLVILSEHPTVYSDSFSIHVADPVTFNLNEFGLLDFPTTIKPDLATIDALQRDLRKKQEPITLSTHAALNYASAVPTWFFTQELPELQIIPISHCERDAKSHFQFGRALKDVLANSKKRVSIIAAGDLSHRLTSESPDGFHKEGERFDRDLQEIVAQKNASSLLAMKPERIEQASQGIYQQLCMLFGILEHVQSSPVTHYEAPFGVGYLVADIPLI